MSREQRTRLNVMISEQTGTAAPTPGRSTRTEESDEQQDEAAAPLAPARRSVFDAPFTADVERETEPDADLADDTTPRRG